MPSAAPVSPAPLPDANRLVTLVQVARHGSIAGAARAMGVTASAVSQQISALETACGTALIDRHRRGVSLTGAGQVLQEQAEEVMRLLEQAGTTMSQLGGQVAGRARVGAIASAAAAILLPASSALARTNPAVTMSVSTLEPSASLEMLIHGSLDVAVIDVYDHVPMPMPGHLTAEELLAEPLVLVSSPATDLPEHPSLTDLRDREWVLPPGSAACGAATRYACRSVGFEPLVRWETDDLLLLVAAVSRGEGLALLPRRAVADSVAPVQMRRLAEPELRRRILMVSRVGTADRPIVRACLNALRQVARGR